MKGSTAECLVPAPVPGVSGPPLRIASRRLGEFEVAEERIFTLPRGLVGLATARRFVLLDHRPGSLFRWMLCVDDPDLAFVVADPRELVAGYEMPVEAAVRTLGCAAEDVAVMVVLAISASRQVTANLLAPVVVDCRARAGCQLVLEGSGLDPAHPVAPRG